MRYLLLICLLSSWIPSLWAQNQPDNLVHFPHYVAIGPTVYTANAPTGYNLLVEGGILTERLRVATRNGTNWADYVLAPAYRLMPLSELERYIARNGHLPGIPSGKDIATDGIDVAPMQACMMAKIEELTLHLIRQQKEIDHLSRQITRNSHSRP